MTSALRVQRRPGGARPSRPRLACAVSVLGALALLAGSGLAGHAEGPDDAELPLPLMRLDGSQQLPEFAFAERAPDGKTSERGFIEWRGRPVVVTAWASWCGVCRGEMPKLDRLAAELQRAGSVRVAALSIDDGGLPVVERTLAQRGLGNLRAYHDTEKMFFSSIGAWGVPTTVIADAQGRIVARANGPVDWSAPAVRAFLQSLVADAAKAKPAAVEAQLMPAGWDGTS